LENTTLVTRIFQAMDVKQCCYASVMDIHLEPSDFIGK